MNACYLVERLGPYHAARLDRAGADGGITVVELNAAADTYAWGEVASGSLRFRRRAPTGSATLETVLADSRPDVVFLNGWSDRGALRVLRWCRRRGVPAVMMSDSQRHDEPRVFWKEWLKRGVLAGCAAAFVAGRRHAAYLTALGFGTRPVSLGYDVVDNAHFARGADETRAGAVAARVRLRLPERYFLCVSRFVPKKNLPRLLRAFAAYRQGAGADAWDLVMLGDGAGREELEAQIHRAGLTGAVHLRGFLQYDALPAHYALAGALVLASTSEQWGLAVNEAMAAGLPVLLSEVCGCAPELVEESVNGWTFDPADEAALARGLARLADPATDLAAMGLASRRIVADWSLDRFAAGFWEAARAARREAGTVVRRGWNALFCRLTLILLLRKP